MTIKTVEDVAQLAGLEPLGSIPVGTSTAAGHPRLEYTDEVKDAYSMLGTAFRVLCQGKHAVLVTSPRSGSGTTTTATYLALSLAKSGMRVLIVDANVHRPSLHSILPCPDTYGPIKSLQDLASWKESSIPLPHLWLNQWKTDIPNLWLLPAGPLGQTPTSLLHEPVLGRLVDRLLGRILDTSEPLQSRLVDMIIFDAAALDQGTDAYLLSALADATVLIVEAGKEHKDTLHRLSVTFQRFGAPILGVVVNRQQEQHQSYFYAPYQVSTERKVVVSPSLDQAVPLPLSRENSGSASAMVNSQEKEQVSVKQSLTLKSLVDRKDVNNLFNNRKEESGYINTKVLDDSDEIKNELPETPLPLLSVYPNIAVDISNNQTAEAQEDAPGRPQFAPLLRFSRAMTPHRENESASEV